MLQSDTHDKVQYHDCYAYGAAPGPGQEEDEPVDTRLVVEVARRPAEEEQLVT